MTPSDGAAGLREPLPRLPDLSGIRRQPQSALPARFREKGLERGAADAQRRVEQTFTLRRQEHVEQDEQGRRLVRELADAALGRVQAHLQSVERQSVADRDGQLAVDHELPLRQLPQRLHHVREIARQRLARLGPELDLLPRPERQAAKAVPFRLEMPAGLVRKTVDEPRFHRRRPGRDRQTGETGLPANPCPRGETDACAHTLYAHNQEGNSLARPEFSTLPPPKGSDWDCHASV